MKHWFVRAGKAGFEWVREMFAHKGGDIIWDQFAETAKDQVETVKKGKEARTNWQSVILRFLHAEKLTHTLSAVRDLKVPWRDTPQVVVETTLALTVADSEAKHQKKVDAAKEEVARIRKELTDAKAEAAMVRQSQSRLANARRNPHPEAANEAFGKLIACEANVRRLEGELDEAIKERKAIKADTVRGWHDTCRRLEECAKQDFENRKKKKSEWTHEFDGEIRVLEKASAFKEMLRALFQFAKEKQLAKRTTVALNKATDGVRGDRKGKPHRGLSSVLADICEEKPRKKTPKRTP